MRIVCLSAEAASICACLGAWDWVVAVTEFASQEGLAPKPMVGQFNSADVTRIAALKPDLVITFSDVQAKIAEQLIRSGCAVLATNQRSLAEIMSTFRMIGGAIGVAAEGNALANRFAAELESLRSAAELKPRVYFEEWPKPMVSGIRWVGELIECAGGIDVFAERRGAAAADRQVLPGELIAANPDIILASWCGRPVKLESIMARPGFDGIEAICRGQLHALEPDRYLQPGPRLLEGAKELRRIFDAWRAAV